MYLVKEMFYSLQGEGAQTGRPAVFCRFSGCNLWNGQERSREKSICTFCDTDFVGTDGHGGGKFREPEELALAVNQLWPKGVSGKPYVICTGGEPMMQVDEALITAFHNLDLEVAVETNGTLPVPESVDWICVSPKGTATLVQTKGDELKLVYPQYDAMPEKFEDLVFDYFYIQPKDLAYIAGDVGVQSDVLRQSIDYCMTHPKWRLSIQTHKEIGIE
ncbi:7-carboxy-7-deazaguanine synthase [Corallincola platygyrae]|uniref:7-carboxy-7-deazaguanine synthase n=1 Tax=Corallincola platygyrae TaxID=1193278 RepID=A0ABW4XHC4_9GAMM